jgi:signal transduction histidine kinase
MHWWRGPVFMLGGALGALGARESVRRRLIGAAGEAELRERQRMAGRLHDDVLARLAAVRLELTCEGSAAAGEIGAIAREIRAIVGDILPRGVPVDAVIGEAVERLRGRGFVVRADIDPVVAGIVDEELASSACELLSNIDRHAGASRGHAVVAMRHGWIVLDVEDDGHGSAADLVTDPADGHVGLALIARRAQQRGGSLLITDRPGGGIRVCVRMRAKHERGGRPRSLRRVPLRDGRAARVLTAARPGAAAR